MKLQIAVAAFVPLLMVVGCEVDHGAGNVVHQSVVMLEDPSPETYALGTALTAGGAVAQRAVGEIFLRGGEVYLSVDVSRASADQLVEVKWIDPSGQVLHRDVRRAPQGTAYVPFSSGETKDWQRGSHHAVVLIDGRNVSDKTFTVM